MTSHSRAHIPSPHRRSNPRASFCGAPTEMAGLTEFHTVTSTPDHAPPPVMKNSHLSAAQPVADELLLLDNITDADVNHAVTVVLLRIVMAV